MLYTTYTLHTHIIYSHVIYYLHIIYCNVIYYLHIIYCNVINYIHIGKGPKGNGPKLINGHTDKLLLRDWERGIPSQLYN